MLQKPASTFIYVVFGVVGVAMALGIGFYFSNPSQLQRVSPNLSLRRSVSKVVPFVDEYQVRVVNDLANKKVSVNKNELIKISKDLKIVDGQELYYGIKDGKRFFMSPEALVLRFTTVQPRELPLNWEFDSKRYGVNSLLHPNSKEVEVIIWIEDDLFEVLTTEAMNDRLSKAIVSGLLYLSPRLESSEGEYVVMEGESIINELGKALINVW